jgi:hypothetical protein
MDELRRAAGMAATGEVRSFASFLQRGLVAVAILGVFALACAFAVIGFLDLAVYFAALPDYGPVRAAGFAALAAAAVMGLLALAVRRFLKPEPAATVERPSPLAAAAAQGPPKTVWDLAALVAAGVLAGLSQKH